MLAWYREHAAEYELVGKARWQHLMIRAGSTRSKGEAYELARQCGAQIYHGASFEEIARQHSEGSTREAGGLHDWTSQGSLASKVLDHALFTLPTGQLSQPIEDEQGFHVIRVLERKDAGSVPFAEAQVEIKTKIKQQRVVNRVKEYLAELKVKTPVWTVFDLPPGGAVADRPGGGVPR
jgi:parvulin-like peptidyl-prolyl isomerase